MSKIKFTKQAKIDKELQQQIDRLKNKYNKDELALSVIKQEKTIDMYDVANEALEIELEGVQEQLNKYKGVLAILVIVYPLLTALIGWYFGI